MKQRNKRWLGLAIAPALLGLIALATPAHAADYTGPCASIPASVSGNIDIDESSCTITTDVTATGFIKIISNSGSITAKKFTSTGGSITIRANNGDVTTDAINADGNITMLGYNGILTVNGNVTSANGYFDTNPGFNSAQIKILAGNGDPGNITVGGGNNVVLVATGNIRVDGDIDVSDSSATAAGAVDINTYSSTEFVIGTSNPTNGVGGKILANTVNGGSDVKFLGGVRVASYNGSIKVTNAGDIEVTATQSRNGVIILNAPTGTISLPADDGGTKALSVDGTTGQGAGIIILKAFTVKAEGTTSLSASNDSVVELQHNIYIAARNLVSSDNAADLFSIAADGSKNAAVILVPVTGMLEYSNMTASGLDFGVTFPNGVPGAIGLLNVSGEGNIKLSAEGDLAYIALGGYVNLSQTNDFDATAKGSGNVISLGYNGGSPSGASLTFGGGKVTLTADGNETQANTIFVYGNDVPAQADDVTLKSNGASGGTNNGGNIFVSLTGTSVVDKFTISANGGSGGGDGGIVTVDVPSGTVNIPGIFSAKAPATGKGGTLTITADEAALTAATLSADAEVEGDGGTVTLTVENELTIDPTSLVSAIAGSTSGNGKGGTVSIIGNAGFAIDSANIAAAAQGSGKGGTITLKAPAQELIFSGNLNADGGEENGEGGSIEFDVGTLALPEPSNTRIKANGHGTGKGGLLKVTADGDITVANGNGTLSLEARNVDATDNNLNGDADGGTIDLIATGALDIYSGAIAVSGGQKGGTLKAKGAEVILSGDFYADGGAQGDGGSITIEANSLTLPAEVNTIIAANGNGEGSGGSVTIKMNGEGLNVSDTPQTVSVQAKSNESGDGGSVTITSDSAVYLNGAAIDVSAGPSGGGLGGNIAVTTDGDITATGDMKANGGCNNGDGGSVVLEGDTVSTLGTIHADGGDSDFCLAIAARGGAVARAATQGTAAGGTIDLRTKGNIDQWLVGPLTALSADGKGAGWGGIIAIGKLTPIDTTNFARGSITARGGPTGGGGQVQIAKAIAKQANGDAYPIYVNKIIKVDGGELMDIANSDGKIKLNGVQCEQWRTGYVAAAVFPGTYWNCIDGNKATGMPVADVAYNKLEGNFRAILGNAKTEIPGVTEAVQIYVMNSAADFYRFFVNRPLAASPGEFGDSYGEVRVAAVHANVTIPFGGTMSSATASGNPNIMRATMLHELSHVLDYIWGRASESLAGDRASDLGNLDALSCATVWSASTTPLCNGVPPANSQIFVTLDPQIDIGPGPVDIPKGHWEFFARVFAARYSADPTIGWQFDSLIDSVYNRMTNTKNTIDGWATNPPASVN